MGRPVCAQAPTVFFAMVVLMGVFLAAPSAQSKPPAPDAQARASFDDLYRRGHETSARIKTLTARFTETTTSALLTRPLVSRGTLAVERPSRVVLRFTDPEQRVVLIEGDRMTMVWPARNIRQVSNISSAQGRVQKYLATGSAAELRRQFDIELRDASERPGAIAVSLISKRKQIRETLTRLDLWVEPQSFLLSAIRMTFANGDTKTMAFEDVATNVPLDPGTFTLDVPPSQ